MENVVLAIFEVESEAYQAFSQLKNDSVNSSYTILQGVIMKNQNGRIIPTDSFDTGIDSRDDTFKGGLIGLLVGILGGPLGVILGGAAGALIGNLKDTKDVNENNSLLEYISDCIAPGETAVVLLVQETNEEALNRRLDQFDVQITRWDAAEVADEVEHERQVEKELRDQARQRMKDRKRADRSAAIEDKRTQLQQSFNDAKANAAATIQDTAASARDGLSDFADNAVQKGSELTDKALKKGSELLDRASQKLNDVANS